MLHAEVKGPPFTRGKKQLNRMEVDKSRDLSQERIHVERVIGILKQKYTILESHVPINFMECLEGEPHSLIDHIVTVRSALCNCCESVVKLYSSCTCMPVILSELYSRTMKLLQLNYTKNNLS